MNTPDTRAPWHGVLVATALPLRADLSVDYEAFAAH
jgi:dihydrodipicolinate synthase/N-acetylneuraminate lyase